MIDNNDLIGVRNGGQPVGNDQQRLAPHQPSQCRLDDRLVFRVCIGRCLVENDDRRVLQHGTGNGDALPLTAGQVTAGCTAYGLIAVLQPHYELVAAAFLRGVNDLRIGRTLSAHADIVHDRKVKEVVVLGYIGDALRTLRQRQRTDVHAAQLNGTVLYIPQRGDKPGDGGFSAAGRPDQCVDRPRGNVQIDSVQYLLVVIGKADIFQLDGVVRRQLFRTFRTLHILAGQHLRHLTHDGRHLRDVIGVGKSGDQRLHNAEGQNNDREKRLRRQCAVHIEKAAHRQDAEKCRREYRHSGHLSEQTPAHPVDEAVRALFCGGDELCIAGPGLTKRLDDLNAADVFHSRVVQCLCRGDRALKLLVIAAEHGHKAENAQRQDDEHGKAHAPVLDEQQHQYRQRPHDVGGHLRQQVGKGGFDGIDPLDDDVLIRAGGTIQHRTQRQRR